MEEPQPLPWEEPGWFERVESWVAVELGRLGFVPHGKLELVRARPWAAVARVATAAGDVWFKEPAPSLAFEPALTAAVSRRCPDFTSEVLATQATWMLTRDAGEQLRAVLKRGGPTPTWDVLLPLYAQLQIELIDYAKELVALGTPDKRPATVSAAYPKLVKRIAARGAVDVNGLRALAPQVESLVEELAGPAAGNADPRGVPRGQRLRARRATSPPRLGRSCRLPPIRRTRQHAPRHRVPAAAEAER